jgi:hypothetical protein
MQSTLTKDALDEASMRSSPSGVSRPQRASDGTPHPLLRLDAGSYPSYLKQ